MNVPEGTDRKFAEIEQAASKDEARPVLTQPYLAIEDGKAWLQATDSYVMARVPVTVEKGDTEGFVPADVLKFARKRKSKEWEPRTITLGETARATNKDAELISQRMDVAVNKFPDVNKLATEVGEPVFSVLVNVDKLLQAAKAIGASQVNLEFFEGEEGHPYKPMRLTPLGSVDARFALVMPLRGRGES